MNLNLFQSRSLKTRGTLLTVGIFVLGIWLLTFFTSPMLRDDLPTKLGDPKAMQTLLGEHVILQSLSSGGASVVQADAATLAETPR